MDIASCFIMESRLALRTLMALHAPNGCKDFYEGVRAVLIDKDHHPKWDPPSLDQVTPASIDALFAPFNPNEKTSGTNTIQDMAKELELLSNSTYQRYPVNFGLPSEYDVQMVLTYLHAIGAKPTAETVLEAFVRGVTYTTTQVDYKWNVSQKPGLRDAVYKTLERCARHDHGVVTWATSMSDERESKI